MGNVIATSIVVTVFLLTTSVVFLFLISSYTNRSFDASARAFATLRVTPKNPHIGLANH